VKVRIVIEYDPDWPDNTDVLQALEKERQDWLNGNVDIGDMDTADVTFDVIPLIKLNGS
jgi:hypothetical protein